MSLLVSVYTCISLLKMAISEVIFIGHYPRDWSEETVFRGLGRR